MCVCVCTRGRIFSRFHLFRSRSCMGVNINHPKVCLRVCTCECVNTSVSKSLMLTTVALRCSELREGDPQRPTFYVKKHLHLYIITLKKTELEEQNYMCGAKVGKKTLSALPACWKRSSLNILGIKRRRLLLLAEHLREQTNRSPGFRRPSYHTGEASAAFTNIRDPVFTG